MKKLIIILTVMIAACNSEVKTGHTEKENELYTSTETKTENGSKWKADQDTKRNVAAMMQVVNDSSYAIATKRMQLHDNLQTIIDTLVKQCKMHGPEHGALHVWLEKVLNDVKKLNDETEPYDDVLAALKKDIGGFYYVFE